MLIRIPCQIHDLWDVALELRMSHPAAVSVLAVPSLMGFDDCIAGMRCLAPTLKAFHNLKFSYKTGKSYKGSATVTLI